MSTFGERLRAFAKARFGTLQKLSTAAGISYQQLSKYATNEKRPQLDALERLRATGVSIDWLIDGTGEMMATGTTGQDEGMVTLPVATIDDAIRIIELLKEERRKALGTQHKEEQH